MTDVETDTLIGQTVAGHYEVLSCLDPAGNTEVFKVKDNRDAVIKVLKIIRSFREDKLDQFLIEAERIKTQVKHPSLAQLQDFGVIREQEKLGTFVYMIYDFLSGRSLYSVLNRQGRIELSEALPIFIQVCDLAKHLQAVGVNNLSLSPRKIMVSDSVQAAKLNETGLSSTLTTLNLDPADTSSAFPEGVLYLSPEQCSQQSTDFRSDVYSLGCIMYECLVGLPPFLSKSPYEVSRMHINEEVKPLRMSRDDLNFPLELDLLVLKSLRKNPLQRQQNMTELYEDLHHVQQELSRVPELTLPGQAGKRSGVAAAILEDLSDLFGIDNSLKIKLAVPIILGLVVIFGSILIGSILPQNIRAADPATLAERDAEKEWQQLDMQAQRDFEHHNLLSAEEHYERALQIAEKFKDDRRRLYGTLQKLQNIYMAEKRYDKSDEIEAHLKAFMEEDAK